MTDCAHLFTDSNGAKDCLERYGVAVIPRVIDEGECEAMKSGVWDYFEQVSQQWPIPIDRADPLTHVNLASNLWMKHNMLMQHFEIGHAQFLWDIRQNPKVAGVFSDLWNCDPSDLTVSFDGAAFSLPPELNRNKGFQKNPWYHCDDHATKATISKNKSEMSCIQGWVTAYDVREGDASLVVMEGSHLHYDDMCVKYDIKKNGDWYKLKTKTGGDYVALGCVERRIVCPAGSLVLWDSRSLHYGGNAMAGRSAPNHRLVGYVCYLPATGLTAANLKKKRVYFDTRRTICHDPCKIKVFSVMPQTYGNEVLPMTPIAAPILTELGMRLRG